MPLALEAPLHICSNVGALIIRIGFWDPLYYLIIRKPQNSIGNYSGAYSILISTASCDL